MMSTLNEQLLQLLRRVGITDTSECAPCKEAVNAAAQKEIMEATQPLQRSTTLTMKLPRSGPPLLPPVPASYTESLQSLHGCLAALEIDEKQGERLVSGPKLGRRDCTLCHGSGLASRRAHFGYSEELETHGLQTPGQMVFSLGGTQNAEGMEMSAGAVAAAAALAAAGPNPLYAFSPQSLPLKKLLLHERPLVGLLRHKAELKRASKANSMIHQPTSTLLIKKAPSQSAPLVSLPDKAPTRDHDWLYSQFEELRFAPQGRFNDPNTEAGFIQEESRNDMPLIKVLDQSLTKFTKLHTLHVSGHQLSCLENLPKNIRVVHANGNRISEVKLQPAFYPPQILMTEAQKRTEKLLRPATYNPLPPPPPPPISFYPNLIHLGLAYNRLDSLKPLLPAASTLVSLDVSWNHLSDLEETCSVLSQCSKLRSLFIQGNPLSFHKFYRAAIIDAFVDRSPRALAEAAKIHAEGGNGALKTSLEMLDGFSVKTHLLSEAVFNRAGGAPSSSASGAATATSQTGGDASVPATGRSEAASPSNTARKAGGAASAKGASSKRRKPTAAELAEIAEKEKQAAIAAAEAARKAEEARIQAQAVHPTVEQLHEPVRLMFVLNGAVKGLINPAEIFAKLYNVPSADETNSKTKRKTGEKGSIASAASPATAGKRKLGGKKDSSEAAPVVNPDDIGWLVHEVVDEGATEEVEPGVFKQVTSKRKAKRQTRYYFEIRLRSDAPSSSSNDGDAGVLFRDIAAVNNQDGNSVDAQCNASAKINQGNKRGWPEEIIRSVEYEWEQLQSPLATPVPVAPALNGAPVSSHSDGVAWVKEIAFAPNEGWRNLLAHLGFDVLLYQRESSAESSEVITSVQREEAPPSPPPSNRKGSGKKDGDSSRSQSPASTVPSPAANKRKIDSARAGAKKKKGAVELSPPEISTEVSATKDEVHTLLGMVHIDSSPLLNVYPRKMITSLSLVQNQVQFRRAPGTITGNALLAPSPTTPSKKTAGLPPLVVDPQQWNPQAERRLPVELGGVSKILPKALNQVKLNDMREPFPAIISPPPKPERSEESKENASAIVAAASSSAAGPTGPGTPKGGASDRGGSKKDKAKKALEEEQARLAALAAQQALDPVYTLSNLSVFLNSRPSMGPGSDSFKIPPPEPTPEEAAPAAAALAAQNKKGRKSPGLAKKAPAPTAAAESSDV